MKVDKMSISMETELSEQVRAAADRAGMSLSAWVAAAAAARLRKQALGEFLDDWQAKHGAITAEELAKAREELGFGGTEDRVA